MGFALFEENLQRGEWFDGEGEVFLAKTLELDTRGS